MNALSYGMEIWTDLSAVLSQFTRVTDRQTEFSSLDRVCILCSAVKSDMVRTFARFFAPHLKPSGYQVVGGCHPPPSFFCIMQLIDMEYNFDFLSSCRIFVGTHFVAEVVLVSHATKKLHPK